MYSLQFQYIISSTATLATNTKLPIALSDFYKEYIVTWTSLCEDNPSSRSKIANQIIWNNLFVSVNSKSIYFFSLFSAILYLFEYTLYNPNCFLLTN